ncbi:LLM class flavin-dependent oxidoreductase [Gordonia pseudamarae]|uniref:LLM class flavin-dependent oxidoreductase n=1 Tax=Gordonia pseudamarae TaxID=2831662 RepID=A0ABX6IFE0_9ACTN|nr:LLM class flavin-dependent oxidoreductase [Gordonia pseudamarae]QHN25645.1 LLM class flavin-dependent oxidoreductase [Gordonia pseudamarae]QHN34577.1 LLM class flavin-dependent oxidoreductase [Gordonia pseudamarae]
MSAHFHWFLPTYGDSRNLMAGGHGSSMSGDRRADLRYLKQLAAAAEVNGFEAVLTPTGLWCEDAWLTTAALIDATETLKFLVAFRPGLTSPTLAAQMAASFQWHSQGRLYVNVVTGGEASEQRAFGDFLTKEARYERGDEFLTVVRRLWESDEPVNFSGSHVRVENAVLGRRPDPLPQVFFGGSSPAAGTVAARHADTYLTWGEKPDAVAEKISWISGLAEREQRTLDYGIRLHVIARETSEQAWAEAGRLLSGLDPQTVAAAQANLARSESEGQRRMLELHGAGSAFDSADPHSLEVYPNLWAGVGLVRGGAGTALVGSYTEVAERIAEYHALGLDHFVLSGYPHLEEAYHFGEGVRPQLARLGLIEREDDGEVVHGAFLPTLRAASS